MPKLKSFFVPARICATGILFLCLLPQVVEAQSEKESRTGATVRGRFVQSHKPQHKIDFSEFSVQLVEQVELPDVAPPQDWDTLSLEQRQRFLDEFKTSAQGQALLAKRQTILDARDRFDIKIEADGKWVVYDVAVGTYGIVNGRVDKNVGAQKFAFELFGQLQVSANVEEVVLDPIAVMVTPLLAEGDVMPEFKVKTDDDSEMTPQLFRDKPLFVYFWSTASQPSVDYQTEIQKMFAKLKDHHLELLSINMDDDRQLGVKQILKSELRGRHGFTDGWEHEMPESFGIRSLPSLWLIDPAGKILLTNQDFRRAGSAGKELTRTVSERIEGGK